MAKKTRRAPVSRDKRFKQRTSSDYGTAERWQHSARTLEYTETAGVFAVRVAEPHLLDELMVMKLIDAPARDAGLKLHHDYHLAGIETRITASYSNVRGAKGDAEARMMRGDAQEAAYQRWRSALRSMNITYRDVVIHVACLGHAPRITQLSHLKDGLVQLAKFYGLAR